MRLIYLMLILTLQINAAEFTCPVQDCSKVLSPYGTTYMKEIKKYRVHIGTDYFAPAGSKVFAVNDGIVSFSGNRGRFGLRIVIKHHNSIRSEYVYISDSLVKVGQRVKKGDLIAYTAQSGNYCGTNLHLEMFENGTRINPQIYIK
jgi:murein DD-endopeptidase MepM/ murein hydrolase activator NlpD